MSANKIKILDGSFGSQLSKYVDKPIDGDPLWSARSLATNPEAIINVHLDYIRAGCDIIETNSYQASIAGFMEHLKYSKEQSYELIQKSVTLAKTAIQRAENEGLLAGRGKPLIAGSVGPYAAHLHDGSEYRGDHTGCTSPETFKNYHEPRIAALVEAGVDLLAIETIPSLKEAETVVQLIKQYPDVKAWLSFSCKDDGMSTAHGDKFKDAAIHCYDLNPGQLIAVGVNCIAPRDVEPLLRALRDARPEIPLIVYANSGEKFTPNTGWDNNSERLEDYVPAWLDLGVKYIGGCCRVCDDDLARIVEEVRKWEQNHS